MIEAGDLAKVPIFRDLSAAELDRVKKLVFERAFNQGATLFMEGMRGEVFYLVKTGRIEILKKRGQEDMVIATLGPGDFVGEMAIIDDEPRSATARVAEDSNLMIITKKCFQDIMQTQPEAASKILLAVLKIVNQRLRETNRKLASA